MKLKIVCLLIAQIAISRAGIAQNFIKMGEPAPELKVKWLKGEPIKNFEKGHVYMVEFWATWCKPCIANMPHLSELSRKYKDKNVSVIGVNLNIADNLSADSLLRFITKMGNKMDYLVAMDGGDNFMQENWMKRGVSNGVPTSFIVDQKGNIAWAGHPAIADSILNEIVRGTNSYEKVEKTLKRAIPPKWDSPWNEKIAEKATRFRYLIYQGKYEQVLKEWDQINKTDPSTAAGLANRKLRALMHVDFKKALVYYKELLAKQDPSCLSISTYEVSEQSGLPKAFYQLAKEFLTETLKDKENPWLSGFGLAAVNYNLGEPKKAIDFFSYELAKFAVNGGAHMTNSIEYNERRLARYKGYYPEMQEDLRSKPLQKLTSLDDQFNKIGTSSKNSRLQPLTKLDILSEKLSRSLIQGTKDEVFGLLDSVKGIVPDFTFYDPYKFRYLLNSEPEKAYDILEKSLNLNPSTLQIGDISMCSALIGKVQNSGLNERGISLANRLCDRGLTTSDHGLALYFHLLHVQMSLKQKDYNQAVQYQQRLIDCMDLVKKGESNSDTTMNVLKKYQLKYLQEYKDKNEAKHK